MAPWMVRAGQRGEWEDLALEKGLAVVGWAEIPDLRSVHSRDEMEALYRQTYLDAKPNTVRTDVAQLWALSHRIQAGDWVVLPVKTRSTIAVGRITGPYEYRSDLPGGVRHILPVKWMRADIPRSADLVGQDLLYSLGAFMTVCQIQRNNAEQRLHALIGDKSAPPQPTTAPDATQDAEVPPNLEEFSWDLIREHVGRKFRGHDLARLVESLLTAEGYRTHLSPPGADGGVDIIAGRGPMGFDPPRLCAQVKSSDQPLDVSVLRELQGVMKNFGATQGLLVGWGGFKVSVLKEAARLYFEIRLWNSQDVVNSLLDNYDRLPADLQAELPLKQIWALVPEE